MPEQTFKSAGVSAREIDLSGRSVQPTGTPAGVIGTAERGPAFIPVTIGNMGRRWVDKLIKTNQFAWIPII